MQSTKTASITQTVSITADELRALLSRAAKNFIGVVDGEKGVKLVSSDATIAEDGSAKVAIVYEQGEPVEAKADATAEEVAEQLPQDGAPTTVVPLTLQMPGAAPAVA